MCIYATMPDGNTAILACSTKSQLLQYKVKENKVHLSHAQVCTWESVDLRVYPFRKESIKNLKSTMANELQIV